MSVPPATSAARERSRAPAASAVSSPAKTALASKSTCSGEPGDRAGIRRQLDRRGDRAAVAVSRPGREQDHLRADGGEAGDRYRRERRPVHQPQARPPRPLGPVRRARRPDATPPWRRRRAPSPPSSTGRRGCSPRPGCCRSGSSRSPRPSPRAQRCGEDGGPRAGGARPRREQVLRAEPLDGLADDHGRAEIDEAVDRRAGHPVAGDPGGRIGMPALDADRQRRERRRRPPRPRGRPRQPRQPPAARSITAKASSPVSAKLTASTGRPARYRVAVAGGRLLVDADDEDAADVRVEREAEHLRPVARDVGLDLPAPVARGDADDAGQRAGDTLGNPRREPFTPSTSTWLRTPTPPSARAKPSGLRHQSSRVRAAAPRATRARRRGAPRRRRRRSPCR